MATLARFSNLAPAVVSAVVAVARRWIRRLQLRG